MKTKNIVNGAAGLVAGIALAASPLQANNGAANASSPRIIQAGANVFMQKDLCLFSNASATLGSEKDKKKAPVTGGDKDVNSGPGKNKMQYGFQSPNGDDLIYMVPDNVMKNILNESTGMFKAAWKTDKKDVTIKNKDGSTKTYEMTTSIKDNAAIIVLVDKTDLRGKDAQVFYIGGEGFEFYKDKTGAVALNFGDYGLMYMDAVGKVSTYRFNAEVLEFKSYSITAKTTMMYKKKFVSPDKVTLNSKEGEISVTGTLVTKKGEVTDTLAMLSFAGKEKIDSAAMVCINPKGNYDRKKLPLSVVPGTNEFYDGHIKSQYSDAMIAKVFGYSKFTGDEYLARLETIDTTNERLPSGKIDLNIIIGSNGRGMTFNWQYLDDKAGMTYKVTEGPVVKKSDGSYAYDYDKIGKGAMLSVLAVEKGEMVLKVKFLDGKGKPYKLLTSSTNLNASMVKEFEGKADANGIIFTVTRMDGVKVVLRINNELVPKNIRDEDPIYDSNFSMLDLSKPMIDFTKAVKQQQVFAQRNFQNGVNNAFRKYK